MICISTNAASIRVAFLFLAQEDRGTNKETQETR